MSITRLNNPRRVSASTIAGVGGYYGWRPTNISGCQLWLDASDPAVMFDATTGGSLVTNGNTVARWEDKSGNARHFTQGTANNRPTLRTNSQNGLATLEFDGSNDRLVGDSTQYIKTNAAFTIYAVYKANSTSGQYPVVFASKSNQTENWRLIDSTDATYGPIGFGSISAGFARGYVATRSFRGTFVLVAVNFGGSGATTLANYAATLNASFKGNFSSIATAGTYGSDTGDASVGGSSNNQFFLNGNIAELIVYDTKLSDANDGVMRSYLSRWGTF